MISTVPFKNANSLTAKPLVSFGVHCLREFHFTAFNPVVTGHHLLNEHTSSANRPVRLIKSIATFLPNNFWSLNLNAFWRYSTLPDRTRHLQHLWMKKSSKLFGFELIATTQLDISFNLNANRHRIASNEITLNLKKLKNHFDSPSKLDQPEIEQCAMTDLTNLPTLSTNCICKQCIE